MNETWAGEFLEPSSPRHWLGTDNLGRDILTRVIYGARPVLIVAPIAAGLSVIAGALLAKQSAAMTQKIVVGSSGSTVPASPITKNR